MDDYFNDILKRHHQLTEDLKASKDQLSLELQHFEEAKKKIDETNAHEYSKAIYELEANYKDAIHQLHLFEKENLLSQKQDYKKRFDTVTQELEDTLINQVVTLP